MMYSDIRDINRDTRSTWAELGSVGIGIDAKMNWAQLGLSMGWISLGDARRLFDLDAIPKFDCVIKGGSDDECDE